MADWLLGSAVKVPADQVETLRRGLFSAVPIFLGGVFNTIAVAGIGTWRHPASLFFGWLMFEIVVGVARLAVLAKGRRAIAAGKEPPALLTAVLSCLWAASVGYGAFISILSRDWLLATIVCLSAAAMVCGICLRNFGTPRLAAIMVLLALTPCAVAGLLAGEATLFIISIQLPIYMVAIVSVTIALHEMMVSRMIALTDLKHSESFNRTILQFSPDYTLILNREFDVVFCNSPHLRKASAEPMAGEEWLDCLQPNHREMGVKAVAMIKSGRTGSFTIRIDPAADQPLWFEVIANPIEDGSGRVVAISRDISHQKRSEEKALWMAHHDALTGLPNRPVLQQRLDALLMDGGKGMVAALLILDVDNFKLINDTLGHDAGDALLSTFADRLRSALSDQDLVARTGGDEFAVIICAESEEEVYASVENIFARLREPFSHDGRLLECSASIGASFIPRHGTVRAEILKAANIALYAAKTGGRAQLKVFEPSMMVEVDRHQMMIAAARQALNVDSIVPHYQPIIALGSGTVIGFEALLRWRDSEGKLRVPQSLSAAFEDPRLGHVLGERMLDKVLCAVSAWIADGVQFGHVAINVAAVDFRSGTFAETLLERLKAKNVPPSALQIEVTETAFLGRSSGNVERALQVLSSHGVRIALDDFGTGYASLSHLNHYPVDLLKIDRSFIAQIGNSADAAAICSAVINLGQCLGMEVIAEGVETPEQEAYLLSVGCNMGQGYLYARALAAAEVPPLVASQPFKARAMDPKASVA